MKKVWYCVLLVFLFASCQSNHPVRIDYPLLDTDSAHQNWSELLAQPGKIDQFKILNTGAVKVPVKGMLNRKKLPQNHPFDKYIWVDVFVFLFHHIEKGWYIIDTGLDSSFQDKGNITGLLAKNYIKASRQQVGQNIAAQLQKEQKDIQAIFFTHLHGDHTAGLPELAPDFPKIVGKGEDHIHIPLLYQSNHLSAKDTLQEMDWAKGQSIHPFEKVIDIFGDQSFFAISTPGHSSSHTSYVLNTSNETILLTGDASHTKYGFENNIEPGWVDDQEKAEKSLEQLRVFQQLMPSIRVIYGHQL